MGVVIETCVKYPGGPTRMNATDLVMGVRDSKGEAGEPQING
jgi:hypothetical protein